jgi:Carbohydrate family 9 binding domain-like
MSNVNWRDTIGVGLMLLTLLVAGGGTAQGIRIESSHLAQLVYPDETLTLTVTAATPEAFEDGVTVRLLDRDNAVVSQHLLSANAPGVVVFEMTSHAEGPYAFHVHLGDSPAPDANPVAFTRIAVVPRPDPSITAEESPIAVDAWLAWRFPFDEASVERASHLMRRMGIRWVRDRLAWNHVQPERDVWDWSRYESCYRIQSEAGLRVIPVFHDVAAWASPTGESEPAHRPENLEDLTAFTREVARQFGDVIAGVEIGNEFNSPIFWRGPSHDFAGYVKAAAAGLWQGDPDLLRLMGSSTDSLDLPPGRADAAGALDNNVTAFVDIVTPHHYGPPHGLTSHVEWYRESAPGRPIWVTETGSTAIPQVGPFVSEEEREQADYLVEAFERALEAGAERVFYFCLTDFYEHGERPFGLVECRGDHWIPRLGLYELARLAATTRIDDRVAVRMGERVERDVPPVYAAMGEIPATESLVQGSSMYRVSDRGTVVVPQIHPAHDPDDNVINHMRRATMWALLITEPLPPIEEGVRGPRLLFTVDPFPGVMSLSPLMRRSDHERIFGLETQATEGELWSLSGNAERRVLNVVSRRDSRSVLDRLVVQVPIEPLIAMSRPGLVDASADEGAAVFTLTNDTDQRREITVTWGDGEAPRFPFTASFVTVSLDAHASGEIAFPTEPGAWAMDSRDEHIPNNTVRWESGPDSASGQAVPEWNAIAARGGREIHLDDNLEDWMGLWWWDVDTTHTAVGPPATGSGSLRAVWDDEALWIGAIVRDDDLLSPAPLEQPWSGDSLEIYLDLNAPDEIGTQGYNDRVFQIQVVPSLPDLPEGHLMFSRPEGLPTEGIEHVAHTRGGGERVIMLHEIRLPWASLGLDGPPPEHQMGFDWAINDLDADGISRSQMVWRGTMENWRDPSGFARIGLAE